MIIQNITKVHKSIQRKKFPTVTKVKEWEIPPTGASAPLTYFEVKIHPLVFQSIIL
jgi:hypothetical protein